MRESDGVSRRGTPTKEEDVARRRTQQAATVGVAEHGNSAVLVTVAPGWYDASACFATRQQCSAARTYLS
jgi:hypothetical protein